MGKRRGHGEGSIFQRADGRWTASVDLGFVNGKRKRKWIYGKTRKEVADKLKALHRDQSLGINIAPEKQTVEQFLNRWLAYVKGRNRPRTYESYEVTVRRHILPHIGSRELSRLLPEHVDAMLGALKETKRARRKEAKLAPRTVQYTRSVLIRALNRAVKWGLVSRNVAVLTDAPSVPRGRLTPLDEQEARRLLDAVKGHRLEALYRIMLGLGLRRGEALGVRWADVDLKRRTLTVTGAVQRVNGKLLRSAPKTDASVRTLPLPQEMVRVLEAQQQRLAAEREQCAEWQDHDLVFPSQVGTPVEPGNLHRHFKEMLRAAQLPETTRLHDLRHACATFLLAQGVNPKVVQEILGHTKISTTMDIYAHVLPETQREALEKLGGLLRDEEPRSASELPKDASAATQDEPPQKPDEPDPPMK
jgi:integrase